MVNYAMIALICRPIADRLTSKAVSATLGHALTSITLNNCAHVLPGADRLTAEAMERLLG
jgi:hypothetical protein